MLFIPFGYYVPCGYYIEQKGAICALTGMSYPWVYYNTFMSDDLEFFFPELNPAEDGIIPLPPEAMRILELKAEAVQDDGPTRLRVYIEVSAFQKRPYLEVALQDEQGHEVASVSIIEPMQRKNVFTMHIRGPQQDGKFSLWARLFYPDLPDSDSRSIEFTI